MVLLIGLAAESLNLKPLGSDISSCEACPLTTIVPEGRPSMLRYA